MIKSRQNEEGIMVLIMREASTFETQGSRLGALFPYLSSSFGMKGDFGENTYIPIPIWGSFSTLFHKV